MPLYEYECQACEHRLEIRQGFHDKPLVKCPECKKKKLQRLLFAPHVYSYNEPQTVGLLAERNTNKLGKYEKDAKEQEYMSYRKKGDTELSKMPGSRMKTSDGKPWYRKTKTDKKINKMTNAQKKDYILTGKTPL